MGQRYFRSWPQGPRARLLGLDPGVVGYGRRPMIMIGLTGGIGSGKSAVSSLLAARGAIVIDADAISRELQEPGQPVLAAMVERFGRGILRGDASLDRQAVADLVFADPDAVADLNAIVHPAVGVEIAKRLQDEVGTDHVVVLDVPLMVESGRHAMHEMDTLIVVDVDPELAVERLVRQRGMREDDVRARMARQASRADRLARADIVVDNSGTLDDLKVRVDEIWADITAQEVPSDRS